MKKSTTSATAIKLAPMPEHLGEMPYLGHKYGLGRESTHHRRSSASQVARSASEKLPNYPPLPTIGELVSFGVRPHLGLQLNEGDFGECDQHHHEGGCRNRLVVLAGHGKNDYPLPNVDTAVRKTLEYIDHQQKLAEQIRAARRFLAQRQSARRRHGFSPQHVHDKSKGSLSELAIVQSLIPQLGGIVTPTTGSTLYSAAGGLEAIMHKGRYFSVIAERLDPLRGATFYASKHYPAKYQPTVRSLNRQIGNVEALYAEAIPRLLSALQARYPDEPEEKLLYVALNGLDRQLMEILYVLSIWTDAFAQRRDGRYEQLELLVFMVEQAFHLFRTGNVTGDCDAKCQERLGKAAKYHIGDVFTARFSNQGPATIPGAKGPVGAHAIEVPHDEATILTIMGPLYFHELRHDVFADIPGMADEITMAAVVAIQKAYQEGKLKFKSETIKIGKQTFRTVDLVTQINGQTLSETDADVVAILTEGPAFMYSMLASFAAFNAKGRGVFEPKRLLRPYSHYVIGEEGELIFEPHMPDFARAYVVAAALDLIGCPAEAAECRALATQAAGTPTPTKISWHNADSESKFKFAIEVPLDDLLAAAPFVVDAIVNTPLESLGGRKTSDHINWNPHRQEKVDALAEVLMEGKSQIPADMGDVYGTTVAAAAITAYWGLCKSGTNPILAAEKIVDPAARLMLLEVRKRFPDPDPTVPATVESVAPSASSVAPVASEGSKT
jgi:hypothetical protein